ncbi:hypothetical protein DOY81_004383 [Sarcophaga bullata]|nr:hypothetical protein DOY81_004383 [Sarcophaga bullata]
MHKVKKNQFKNYVYRQMIDCIVKLKYDNGEKSKRLISQQNMLLEKSILLKLFYMKYVGG